jgi:hypothetical protein
VVYNAIKTDFDGPRWTCTRAPAVRLLWHRPLRIHRAGPGGVSVHCPQLNGLPALPAVTPGTTYYWPACATAAMATSAANKASIDSLEAANTTLYQKDRLTDELTRSADFGKQIAAAVFEWSKSDGNDNTTPYTPPVGVGL